VFGSRSSCTCSSSSSSSSSSSRSSSELKVKDKQAASERTGCRRLSRPTMAWLKTIRPEPETSQTVRHWQVEEKEVLAGEVQDTLTGVGPRTS
jgi:hypothetical protein